MAASAEVELSQFAVDIAEGLSSRDQKRIAPKYFYDELGSVLFEAITLLPEYGLTRADERLLRLHAHKIIAATGSLQMVAELGSGTGHKTRHILTAAARSIGDISYAPIDVSPKALAACERKLYDIAEVRPVCADWMEGLREITCSRVDGSPLLVLFLGSSIGNLERSGVVDFLQELRSNLRAGDFFLLGADLVKSIDRMIAAYDDPTGITAAFNLNLLGRINRELNANFDLRSFVHEVRWNPHERRIEMHLLSCRDQVVYVAALDSRFQFRAGETICTEFSHKFTKDELISYALSSGFRPIRMWIDNLWPFAEALWQANG